MSQWFLFVNCWYNQPAAARELTVCVCVVADSCHHGESYSPKLSTNPKIHQNLRHLFIFSLSASLNVQWTHQSFGSVRGFSSAPLSSRSEHDFWQRSVSAAVNQQTQIRASWWYAFFLVFSLGVCALSVYFICQIITVVESLGRILHELSGMRFLKSHQRLKATYS